MAKKTKKKVSKKLSNLSNSKAGMVAKDLARRIEKEKKKVQKIVDALLKAEKEKKLEVGVRDTVQNFINEMKERGVLMSVQYKNNDTTATGADAGAILTSMNTVEALGYLEFAKLVTTSGIGAHQHFDSLVQSLEARPDLIERFKVQMEKIHAVVPCPLQSEPVTNDETGGC